MESFKIFEILLSIIAVLMIYGIFINKGLKTDIKEVKNDIKDLSKRIDQLFFLHAGISEKILTMFNSISPTTTIDNRTANFHLHQTPSTIEGGSPIKMTETGKEIWKKSMERKYTIITNLS